MQQFSITYFCEPLLPPSRGDGCRECSHHATSLQPKLPSPLVHLHLHVLFDLLVQLSRFWQRLNAQIIL